MWRLKSGAEESPMTFLAWIPLIAALMMQQPAPKPASQPTLDYEFFKARIQPIFTTKRPGNARCVSCHATGTPMRLQALPAGNAIWNDEDSRKNFDVVRARVMPGDPMK